MDPQMNPEMDPAMQILGDPGPRKPLQGPFKVCESRYLGSHEAKYFMPPCVMD